MPTSCCRIEETLASASVMLIVIGPGWLDASVHGSSRRLDHAGDHVRREIELALTAEIRVIPVLVDGARMPSEAQLPAALRNLARRSALFIDDTRFEGDMAHLVGVVADAAGQRFTIPSAPRKLGNLPAPLSSVVGIEDTLETVRAAVRSSRLVTLTGAGGSGKTTLALAYARSSAEPWASSTWFVPLSPVSGDEGAVDAVMAALDVGLDGDPCPAASDRRCNRRSDLLLILDNCEHVLDGVVGYLKTWSSLRPGRARAGDQPRASRHGGRGSRGGAHARPPVRPFDQGAVAHVGERPAVPGSGPCRRSWVRDNGRGPAAHRIGLPHARGPAACDPAGCGPRASRPTCRARRGAARSIADTTDRGGGAAHHRTITAAIDWSYRLLDPELRRGFDRLSVFRGGFAAEGMSAVTGLGLRQLDDLGDRSLLLRWPTATHRFRMSSPCGNSRRRTWSRLGRSTRSVTST